jgi:hypothetical protein
MKKLFILIIPVFISCKTLSRNNVLITKEFETSEKGYHCYEGLIYPKMDKYLYFCSQRDSTQVGKICSIRERWNKDIYIREVSELEDNLGNSSIISVEKLIIKQE